MGKVLVLVFVVLVGAAAFGANALFNTPASAPPAPPAKAAAPAPTAASGEASVSFDEATLTREVNGAVSGKPLGDTPMGPATARDMTITLRDGYITTNGTAAVGGASAPFVTRATVDVANGRPVVAVQDASVGGIPLPEATKQTMRQALQQQLDSALAQQRMTVRAVSIRDGVITIVGTRS